MQEKMKDDSMYYKKNGNESLKMSYFMTEKIEEYLSLIKILKTVKKN